MENKYSTLYVDGIQRLSHRSKKRGRRFCRRGLDVATPVGDGKAMLAIRLAEIAVYRDDALIHRPAPSALGPAVTHG